VLASPPEELIVDGSDPRATTARLGAGRVPLMAVSRRVVAAAEKEEGGGCGSASFGIQVA